MRVLTFDVPPQEVKFIMGMFSTFTSLSFLPLQILTKDSVTVFVDAIMYYKVVLMFFLSYLPGVSSHKLNTKAITIIQISKENITVNNLIYKKTLQDN